MAPVHAFTDDVLGDCDATAVAAAIAAGDFSPAEAADAALARIDAVNPELNAVAIDDRDRARSRAADNAFPAGVFAGVPSMIKNNTRMQGLPTRHGSAATADTPAPANEPFTDQLLATGLNILGATTLPAFGLTGTTEYADRPPTRNPWNTGYSSGGSSGGSSALVAAGAVPIAHGNDGGGSIRIPAAACGLVGLKPTRDRMVAAAESKHLPVDLLSSGVVSRSVRDTARFIADAERYRRAPGLPEIGLVQGPSGRRLRIAVLSETVTGERLDDDTQGAVADTATLLDSLGHRTEFVPTPLDRGFITDFIDYWSLLAFAIDHFGAQVTGKGFNRHKLDPFTLSLAKMFHRRFWRTPFVIRALRHATDELLAVFDRFDLVLSPTLGHATPEIGYLDPAGDFPLIIDRLIKYVAFTPANNTSGTPAITLPLSTGANGLPVGVHFTANDGDERTLLELAFELEAARGFARIQDVAG